MRKRYAFMTLAAIWITVCSIEFNGIAAQDDQRRADAQLKEAEIAGRAAAALAGPQLSHPLPYTFSIESCLPSGRQCTPTKYYIPKSFEEE